MNRKEFLEAAEAIISGKEYGAPEDNFAFIADLWNAYDKSKTNKYDTAHDVAIKMALLKIARIGGGKHKDDNYIDLIGYGACAGAIGKDEEMTETVNLDERGK